jgi:D-beta-D-heptose 7-phosphate kinase/D-beta-D-heptose 1-phosphate adenosyltransferase
MLDEYLWGEIGRISPEAPVPVMQLKRAEVSLGGAGNVARNVASLGARVSTIGVVGTDRPGTLLLGQLDHLGIDRHHVFEEPGRPTTRKTRLMSAEHNQQVFRFDEELTEELTESRENQLLDALRERIPSSQVIVCSDYLKGVLTARLLTEVAGLARRYGVPLVTAPKDIHPEKYASASVLMPNFREFCQLAGYRENTSGKASIDSAARELLDKYCFQALLVTRGRDGMSLFEKPNGMLLRQDIPALTQSVYDVTGAGDTALGVFSLSVAAGASRSQSAYLANVAAGIVVGKRGTACVTPHEIMDRLAMADRVSAAGAYS